MPDLFVVFERRWKFILGLTITATVIAVVIAMVLPKQYLSVATALPVNSVTALITNAYGSRLLVGTMLATNRPGYLKVNLQIVTGHNPR